MNNFKGLDKQREVALEKFGDEAKAEKWLKSKWEKDILLGMGTRLLNTRSDHKLTQLEMLGEFAPFCGTGDCASTYSHSMSTT